MGRKREDLKGRLYGRLTVLSIGEDKISKGGQLITRWNCKCQCGNEVTVPTQKLKNGGTKSCGCLAKEVTSKRRTKHGFSCHPIYKQYWKLWKGIYYRCKNVKCPNFKNYGGRGITIYKEWVDNPLLFGKYIHEVLGPKPSCSFSLDRINNNGNYEPGNLRWATNEIQANNKRNNVK